jgi:Secretion system C-terminal sorting domain
LVDSFRNVAASQGFVSFKINQKKDVALGSKINNEADIYFDYNAPIRTNKTLHTIGKDFIVSVLQINSASPNVKINVFPNPFSAEATIEITGFEKRGPLSINSNFSLFDALGRQLHSEKFEGNTYLFKRQDLTTGIYFFRIENNGQLIGTGKFLIR